MGKSAKKQKAKTLGYAYPLMVAAAVILTVFVVPLNMLAAPGGYLFSPDGGAGSQLVTCRYSPEPKDMMPGDGVVLDNCYDDRACGSKFTCCDYKKDKEGKTLESCECKGNLCGKDNKKCKVCAAFGEGSGWTSNGKIAPKCAAYVMKAIENRRDLKGNYAHLTNDCDVVAEGGGGQYPQFDAYRCNCYGKESPLISTKYCRCCSGDLSEEEKELVDQIEGFLGESGDTNLENFEATHFNNAGMSSWAKKNCEPVPNPPDCIYTEGKKAGQPVFDFYKCP